jgi:hypothetical protein
MLAGKEEFQPLMNTDKTEPIYKGRVSTDHWMCDEGVLKTKKQARPYFDVFFKMKKKSVSISG